MMFHVMRSNGEVEGPHRSAPGRRGRTISQRPRRQTDCASRTPPKIVRDRHLRASIPSGIRPSADAFQAMFVNGCLKYSDPTAK
jgi:hypothetical protein